jgi:hypothetical protein
MSGKGKEDIDEDEDPGSVDRDYCDVPFCDQQGKLKVPIEVNISFL